VLAQAAREAPLDSMAGDIQEGLQEGLRAMVPVAEVGLTRSKPGPACGSCGGSWKRRSCSEKL
jgi:hypothetical protein